MPTVLLDTDIGDDIDDAWALGVCLVHPDINLLGVTTVYGNTPARALIARWIIDSLGADVEVAAGEGQPFTLPRKPDQPKQLEAIPDRERKRLRPHRNDGVSFLAQKAQTFKGDDLVLLTLGPLINVARLFTDHPEAAKKIDRIVAMVGTFLPEAPNPEYNARVDPKATKIVFESGKPLTMVSLDVTLQCRFTQADLDSFARFVGPEKPSLRGKRLLVHRLLELTRVWEEGSPCPSPTLLLHDALAALVVVEPTLVTLTPMRVIVDEEGRTLQGDGKPNCLVATGVFKEAVVNRIKELLTGQEGGGNETS